jgi:hypothetical protein
MAQGAGRKAQGIGPGVKRLFGVFSVIFCGEAIRNQDIPHSSTLRLIPYAFNLPLHYF